LAQSIKSPKQQFALKILKKTFLKKRKESVEFAKQEMEIQKKLSHKNIVKVHTCGENGIIKKASGSTIDGLFYLVMDYVPEGLMYDIIEHYEGCGEMVARFFMK
jgi:serine/threonine protein kinase